MLSEKPDLGVHFPSPPLTQWAELVEKIMKGRSVESMTVESDEGIPIRPLYTSTSASLGARWPDSPPYTRGSGVLARRQAGWDLCQVYDLAELSFVKERIKQDVSRGVNSVWLRIRDGQDFGLAVDDLPGLESVLSSIDLKAVPVVLDGGKYAWPLFCALNKIAKDQNLAADELSGAVHFDPLSDLLGHGSLKGESIALDDLSHALKLRPTLCPALNLLSISSLGLHNAGASGAQELGFTLSSLVYYLRAMEARGLAPEEVVPAARVSLGLGRDMFREIAKTRALRALWSRVLELCGVAPELGAVHIHGVSSGTTQSQRDPWVNMLRSTSEAFAGTVAGVDTLTILPFDRSLGAPSSLGYRMAGNLQILLSEEAHLGRVADPAGGSWFIEELTKSICEKAWSFFQCIEAKGGVVKALSQGFIGGEIAKVVATRRKAISRRKAAIVGVSEFPESGPLEQRAIPNERPKSTVETLPKAEATLSVDSEERYLGTVRSLEAQSSFHSLFCARRLGEEVEMTPIPPFKWAADWEALRAKSDQIFNSSGTRPRVYLAKIGALRDYKARAAFAERFFVAGGFEIADENCAGEPGKCVAEFQSISEGQSMGIVLCGGDNDYSKSAAEWAKAFASVNPAFIALAGRGGENEEKWRDAGIAPFIHIGCDGIEILTELQKRVGA